MKLQAPHKEPTCVWDLQPSLQVYSGILWQVSSQKRPKARKFVLRPRGRTAAGDEGASAFSSGLAGELVRTRDVSSPEALISCQLLLKG